jgi:phenylalanyl-tRNA synthetase beta chain
LANPISTDLEIMRPSVLPNLVAAAGRNLARGSTDPALFEIGAQFDGPEPGQQRLTAAGIRADGAGSRHWQVKRRSVDVFDAKADALAALSAAGLSTDSVQVTTGAPSWYHPGRSGQIRLGNKVVALFGELHPQVLSAMDIGVALVGFEVFLDEVPLPKIKATKTRPALKASAFQPLDRDFAFVVDASIAADQVARAAKGADKSLITDVKVFDLYVGPGVEDGKKSVAIAVTLQPVAKTLTDQDIEAVSKLVVDAVIKATGGQLRG